MYYIKHRLRGFYIGLSVAATPIFGNLSCKVILTDKQANRYIKMILEVDKSITPKDLEVYEFTGGRVEV